MIDITTNPEPRSLETFSSCKFYHIKSYKLIYLFKLMSKRYSGKSFRDSSVMKKPKLTFKEKRKLKDGKKKKKWSYDKKKFWY